MHWNEHRINWIFRNVLDRVAGEKKNKKKKLFLLLASYVQVISNNNNMSRILARCRKKGADFHFCTLNSCLEIFKEIARFS